MALKTDYARLVFNNSLYAKKINTLYQTAGLGGCSLLTAFKLFISACDHELQLGLQPFTLFTNIQEDLNKKGCKVDFQFDDDHNVYIPLTSKQSEPSSSSTAHGPENNDGCSLQ